MLPSFFPALNQGLAERGNDTQWVVSLLAFALIVTVMAPSGEDFDVHDLAVKVGQHVEQGAELVTLRDPRAMVPNTIMAFPGIRDDQDRANVVAYLETLRPAP